MDCWLCIFSEHANCFFFTYGSKILKIITVGLSTAFPFFSSCNQKTSIKSILSTQILCPALHDIYHMSCVVTFHFAV